MMFTLFWDNAIYYNIIKRNFTLIALIHLIFFIFLGFVFIWSIFSFYMLMIYLWFKTKARFGSEGRRKRNEKAWFRDNFFNFQIFETFGYLEIDFSINLSKYFWITVNSFVNSTFLLKPWHTIIWFEACRYNAVIPRILCDMYL